jgi:hypothetical protein
MRIKKKHIREELDPNTTSKVDQVEDAIEQTGDNFKTMGIDEPDNMKLAADVVAGALKSDDDMSEAVRLTMTKDELIESVLTDRDRKVIKTIKIKDLRK